MAYKVIILYRLYMPPYFLGTFTEYPDLRMVQQRSTRMAKLYQEQSTIKMDNPLLPNIKMRMDDITRK